MKKCYHCGSNCSEEQILSQDMYFCCVGCKTVYELLSSCELDKYYELNDKPGLKPNSEKEYHFLESEEVCNKLSLLIKGGNIEVELEIPAIHCISCVWLLEKLYKFEDGILESKVSFSTRSIVIRFDKNKTSLANIVRVLSKLGYPPVFDSQNSIKSKSLNRNELLKVVVAGICFGNIMLFSFPGYFGLEAKEFSYFQYLNFIFSLPVVFYSGSHYFNAFINFLQFKILTLEIPIFIGIMALFIRSCYDLVQGAHGYWDSLAGLIFFLLLGKKFQDKSIEQLNFDRDYRSFFPFWTRRKNIEGIFETIVADKISIGDILLVKNNEIIPCDARILSQSAYLDYSFVSGESELVKVEKGDVLFAGAKLNDASIEVEAIKDVHRSYLTSLWSKIEDKQDVQINLVNTLSKYFTPIVLLVAIISSSFSSTPFLTFTAITIIACPCALALSYPLTLGFATRSLAEIGLYLKDIHVIEAIAKLDCIVFDKTGTLTECDNKVWDYTGTDLSSEDNNYIKTLSHQSTHPLSVGLNEMIKGELISVAQYEEHLGKGISAIIEGNKVRIGSLKWLDYSLSHTTNNNTIAYSKNGKVIGVFSKREVQRKGVMTMIRKLKTKNYLLSGDKVGYRQYLSDCFAQNRILYEQTPKDKLKKIQNLLLNHNVGMIGDGLNDAGALLQSDVGIAVVGEKNSFFPASDALLQANSLVYLDNILKFSKGVLKVVLLSFTFSIVYNLLGIYLAIIGILTPLTSAILMPLSSVSILLTAYWGVKHLDCKYFCQD